MATDTLPTEIHPTAIVSEDAELGAGVIVRAYAIIGPGVRVGDRTVIDHHADVRGPLEIGPDCVIGFSTAIGHDPQIRGGDGQYGATKIGARNVLREFSQVHRSRYQDKTTVIQDDGYFMANAHVGHDSQVEDNVTLVNGAALGGHVHVECNAFLGGGAMVHQFCRVGTYSMLGGHAGPSQDVPPYCRIGGARNPHLEGLNAIGIRRAGFSPETRQALKDAYKALFRQEGNLDVRIASIPLDVPEVAHLVKFVQTTERGVIGISGTKAED